MAAILAGEAAGLLQYARTLTGDQQRAEDLVQDTVVRALERADSFRGESSPRTWLHRIMHNLAVDAGRRHREDSADPATCCGENIDTLWANPDYTIDAAAIFDRLETRRALQDALLRLPLLYRAVVVLHDIDGHTVAQIAQIQHIGVPAAKQRLRRGRMMLVSHLAEARSDTEAPTFPLRCWDARSKVSDYLDDDLPPRDRELLERHLAHCPTCPPLYAGLAVPALPSAAAGTPTTSFRHTSPHASTPPTASPRPGYRVSPSGGATDRGLHELKLGVVALVFAPGSCAAIPFCGRGRPGSRRPTRTISGSPRRGVARVAQGARRDGCPNRAV
jgi:RNA polymerase sigma-70 factor (ECF subfamily)